MYPEALLQPILMVQTQNFLAKPSRGITSSGLSQIVKCSVELTDMLTCYSYNVVLPFQLGVPEIVFHYIMIISIGVYNW